MLNWMRIWLTTNINFFLRFQLKLLGGKNSLLNYLHFIWKCIIYLYNIMLYIIYLKLNYSLISVNTQGNMYYVQYSVLVCTLYIRIKIINI